MRRRCRRLLAHIATGSFLRSARSDRMAQHHRRGSRIAEPLRPRFSLSENHKRSCWVPWIAGFRQGSLEQRRRTIRSSICRSKRSNGAMRLINPYAAFQGRRAALYDAAIGIGDVTIKEHGLIHVRPSEVVFPSSAPTLSRSLAGPDAYFTDRKQQAGFRRSEA